MKPSQTKRGKLDHAEVGQALSASGVMDRLQAVVLMAGTVRPTRMQESIGRSLLDLPLDAKQTILGRWHWMVQTMSQRCGIERLPLQVRLDQAAAMPRILNESEQVVVNIERDSSGYRGTGGVLHDLSRVYDSDDYLLVASARQVLLEPLCDLMLAMVETGGDVCLLAHDDGTPSGLMLIRCGVLDEIPPVGFQDMKEQVLPAIAAKHAVKVVHFPQPTGLPVRRRTEYMRALRRHHLLQANGEEHDEALDEDWQAAYSIIEDGSDVDPSALIHDSVVLAGATVGADAVVVRSVVCPGGVVTPRQTAVDSVVDRLRKGSD